MGETIIYEAGYNLFTNPNPNPNPNPNSNFNPSQNPEGTTIPEAVPKAGFTLQLKIWEDIESVEIKLPMNIYERTRELAKLLNLRAYDVNYEPHYKIYDLWLLFELIFRYPLVKSFYYASEVKKYHHTILTMVYSLFPYVAINDYPLAENREEEIKITDESYRAYTVHEEMTEIVRNINNNVPVYDYNSYSTDNLRKALETIVYLIRYSENDLERYNQASNNLNKVGLAKDLGEKKLTTIVEDSFERSGKALKSTMKLGGKLLVGANIFLSVSTAAKEAALVDLKNNSIRICKVLFTRDIDANYFADNYCLKDIDKEIAIDNIVEHVNENSKEKGAPNAQ